MRGIGKAQGESWRIGHLTNAQLGHRGGSLRGNADTGEPLGKNGSSQFACHIGASHIIRDANVGSQHGVTHLGTVDHDRQHIAGHESALQHQRFAALDV